MQCVNESVDVALTERYYLSHGQPTLFLAMYNERSEMNTQHASKSLKLTNLRKLVNNGHFFSVEFVKRTNNKPRKMLARVGVHKNQHGGRLRYSPAAKNLLSVYDVRKHAYRMIPAERVTAITVDGQRFEF